MHSSLTLSIIQIDMNFFSFPSFSWCAYLIIHISNLSLYFHLVAIFSLTFFPDSQNFIETPFLNWRCLYKANSIKFSNSLGAKDTAQRKKTRTFTSTSQATSSKQKGHQKF